MQYPLAAEREERVEQPADLEEIQQLLTDEEKAQHQEALAHRSSGLRLLTIGKKGEGKSTFIHGITGAKEIGVDGLQSSAKKPHIIHDKDTHMHGLDIELPIMVFDSPGLQDNPEIEVCLREIRQMCQNPSLVLYCTKMTNIRLKNDDKKVIEKLTSAFGAELWRFAILVLTFANKEDVTRRNEKDEDKGPEPAFDDDKAWDQLGRERFQSRVQKWHKEFHQFLINEIGVSTETVEKIPVTPVGDYQKTRENREPLSLPDRDNWLADFWKVCSQVRHACHYKDLMLEDKVSQNNNTANDDEAANKDETTEEQSHNPTQQPEQHKFCNIS
ncbi:PREDICTED: uncharacterized protein LOC109592349 [Amphimedon queenslandica]|uniref:AIG1-type G domain-containing protein n=1 Tax=Amphimedon queenslandica TaxID=400682 RepID=A0A1X7SMG8_AMPQE|nr:PREDICTED: uncharacterized protein LOC109592349 [Amphimedon queenslandica]|eukprot:XP_019863371.1 PREDICTED: uncharacterized protein LOC109592349 [Amphimedon queenslandica]